LLDNNINIYGFSYITINRLLENDILERENRSSGPSSNISPNQAHRNMKRVELSYSESENTAKSKQYNKDVYNSLKERREFSDYSSSNHKKKRSLIKKIDHHFEQKIFKTLDTIMQSRWSSMFDPYSFICFKNKKLRRITIPAISVLVIGLVCIIFGKATSSYTTTIGRKYFETIIENPKKFQLDGPMTFDTFVYNYSNVAECDYCTGCKFYTAGTVLMIMGLLIMVYISLKIYKYMEIQELKKNVSLGKN
ncbi:Protein of unknown function, putative, partial [Plasmodium vivax]